MTIRVFVVEDHPSMQQAYTLLLESEPDMELCGLASSGEEALPALRQTACDIALVDVSLPGMSGIEFVTQLHHALPHLPILVISGHAEAMYARQAVVAGAWGYLNKLELPVRLPDTIRQVLRGSAPENGHA